MDHNQPQMIVARNEHTDKQGKLQEFVKVTLLIFGHLWNVVFEDVQRRKLAQGRIGQNHCKLMSQLRRNRSDPRVGKKCQKTWVRGILGSASLIHGQEISSVPSGIHLVYTTRIYL